MIVIKSTNIADFVNQCKEKKLYCFGCGKQSEKFLKEYEYFHIEEYLVNFIDNDIQKAGQVRIFNSSNVPVIHYTSFIKQELKNSIVLISSSYFTEIIRQMDNESVLDGLECYVDFLLMNNNFYQDFQMTLGERNIIPKKIHYCWFGGAPMPERFLRYIESWKKYCPSYEIIRWDESNYDVSKNQYMKQAYDCKKWGFVPDYARVDIIYQYGGVYLDTDVEIIKPLDDLLYDEMYCGFESVSHINFGHGFGSVKGHKILEKVIEDYEQRAFVLKNGELDLTPSPALQSEVLRKEGFCLNGLYQKKKKVVVYPKDVMCPQDYFLINDVISDRTYSIHHYAATWCDEKMQNDRSRIVNGLDKIKGRIITK